MKTIEMIVGHAIWPIIAPFKSPFDTVNILYKYPRTKSCD